MLGFLFVGVSKRLDIASDIGLAALNLKHGIILGNHLLKGGLFAVDEGLPKHNVAVALFALLVLSGAESWFGSGFELAEALFPVVGVHVLHVVAVFADDVLCAVRGERENIEVADHVPGHRLCLRVSIWARALPHVVDVTVASEGSLLVFNLDGLGVIVSLSLGFAGFVSMALVHFEFVLAVVISALFFAKLVVMLLGSFPVFAEGGHKVGVSVEIALGLYVSETIGAVAVSLLEVAPVVIVVLGVLQGVLDIFRNWLLAVSKAILSCSGGFFGGSSFCCRLFFTLFLVLFIFLFIVLFICNLFNSSF